jgi:hypothetical protein
MSETKPALPGKEKRRAPDRPLDYAGSVFGAVRLVCREKFSIHDEVTAFVCGIRIAGSVVDGTFDVGDIIEFPIDYLPWIELPTEIHLVNQRTGLDICPPVQLRTYDQALALVGPGDVTVESIAVDKGILRGLAINRTNGLVAPQMFARINGLVPRSISVEPPRMIETGGASFQFAAQLHPADLVENGLTADIFMLGVDRPLASIAYRRDDVDDISRRIVELEAELAQLKTAMAFKFNTQNADVTARMDIIQQRIDTFIEYAASFMFDRIASQDTAMPLAGDPVAPELRAKVNAFLDIVRGGGRQSATSPGAFSARERNVAMALNAPEFSYGWYDVEDDRKGQFRWMSSDAIIFNPHPGRPLAGVTVGVAAVFGADQPMVRATFDASPGTVSIDRGDKKSGSPWLLRLKPPAGKERPVFQALALKSLLAGSPSQSNADSGDSRVLSIAVNKVLFEYSD